MEIGRLDYLQEIIAERKERVQSSYAEIRYIELQKEGYLLTTQEENGINAILSESDLAQRDTWR